MKCRYIFSMLTVVFSITSYAQENNIRSISQLDYGTHEVGFQFIEAYDNSRPPLKEQKEAGGRITPIYLWYPADVQSTESRINLRDYMKYWSIETDYNFDANQAYSRALENYKTAFFFKKDTPHFSSMYGLDLQTNAIENSAFEKGPHPLVLLTHGSIMNWCFIGEYLASHGFVVAHTPKSGSEGKFHEGGLEGVQVQLRDAQHAIDELSSTEQIDINRIGLLGFSFGSLPAMGLAALDKRVKALVSLDGVLGDPVEGELMYQMPFFSTQKFATPLLHLTGGYAFSADRTRIDKLIFSERHILEIGGMRHTDFAGQWVYDEAGINLSGKPNGDYKSGFKTAMNYVVAFLSAQLTENQTDFEKLWSTTISSNQAVVSKTKLLGKNKHYDYPKLVEMVFSGAYDELFDLYQSNRQLEIPPFEYSTFHDIGSIFYFRGQLEEALEWYGYFVESYPSAAKAYYLLGLVQRNLKDSASARDSMLKARELMPKDQYHSAGQKQEYLNRITRIISNLN